jgi:hypothetical protein
MLTAEETSVLRYLESHPNATVADLTRACLLGSAVGWMDRVASNLDWLGYVVLFPDPGGTLATLQITDRGRNAIVGYLSHRPAVRRQAT